MSLHRPQNFLLTGSSKNSIPIGVATPSESDVFYAFHLSLKWVLDPRHHLTSFALLGVAGKLDNIRLIFFNKLDYVTRRTLIFGIPKKKKMKMAEKLVKCCKISVWLVAYINKLDKIHWNDNNCILIDALGSNSSPT